MLTRVSASTGLSQTLEAFQRSPLTAWFLTSRLASLNSSKVVTQPSRARHDGARARTHRGRGGFPGVFSRVNSAFREDAVVSTFLKLESGPFLINFLVEIPTSCLAHNVGSGDASN
jgi:hypothetical protein